MDNEKKVRKQFKDRLGRLYTEKGESQQEVADLIGTKRQNFGNWCNGKTEPDFEMLVAIADHYNVSVDFLLGRTSAPSPDSSIRAVEELTGLSEQAIGKFEWFNRENRANWAMNIINTIIESDLFDKLVLELRRYALDDLDKPIDTAIAANTLNWSAYPIKKFDVLSLIIDKDMDEVKRLLVEKYTPKRSEYFFDNFIYQHIYSAYREKNISEARFKELIDIVDKMDFDEKVREFKNPNKLHNMISEG